MSEISKKQQKANEENAKKGGVKTEAGKEVSKQNAIKHGLLSEKIVLDSESAADYEDLEKSMVEQLNPADQIEVHLVERIAANIWRLKRLIRIEANLMDPNDSDNFLLADPLPQSSDPPQMPSNDESRNLVRYERMLENSIYRALHELQRIQSARSGNDVQPPLAIEVDL